MRQEPNCWIYPCDLCFPLLLPSPPSSPPHLNASENKFLSLRKCEMTFYILPRSRVLNRLKSKQSNSNRGVLGVEPLQGPGGRNGSYKSINFPKRSSPDGSQLSKESSPREEEMALSPSGFFQLVYNF